MKWPWRAEREPVENLPKTDQKAADQAKREAQKENERVKAKNAYIEWLHEQLLTHSEENHFSEWVLESMKRKRT